MKQWTKANWHECVVRKTSPENEAEIIAELLSLPAALVVVVTQLYIHFFLLTLSRSVILSQSEPIESLKFRIAVLSKNEKKTETDLSYLHCLF